VKDSLHTEHPKEVARIMHLAGKLNPDRQGQLIVRIDEVLCGVVERAVEEDRKKGRTVPMAAIDQARLEKMVRDAGHAESEVARVSDTVRRVLAYINRQRCEEE